jgi:hypothetical protein
VQDLIAPVAYTALQASADPLFVPGRRYYWKAQFLQQISDAAIDALTDGFALATSPLSIAVPQQVGGAISRVDEGATSYGNRNAAYDCFPAAIWENPVEDERHIAWARAFWTAMRPFGTGGVYVNNLGEEGEERVRAAYGTNYARLAALKAKYDADNLFRLNQNIRPWTSLTAASAIVRACGGGRPRGLTLTSSARVSDRDSRDRDTPVIDRWVGRVRSLSMPNEVARSGQLVGLVAERVDRRGSGRRRWTPWTARVGIGHEGSGLCRAEEGSATVAPGGH